MVLTGLLLSLVIAFLVSISLRPRQPRTDFWALFVLVFLLTWAGGIWLIPFGPTFGGIYWLPFLIVGLVVALVLSALVPARPPANEREERAEAEVEAAAGTGIGVFFWILALILLAAIIFRYV